ncbi:fumarylacetoacetate hydrolase family protein [Amycolatopsis orientalis]|uniref:fumarylacetoacetate hydrolase family protein n=1 Tax=Amycolatopsis orientalis TaxID=31958 RepID=UPI00039F4A55|nr:fumarylacetoacetate hydrolase family protein [Amycolatopsis orientalis]
MKLANLAGRAVLVTGDGAADVARDSDGRFGPDPQAVLERWTEFREWARSATLAPRSFDEALLGPPVPRPRQIFAIALNYRAHAAESGFDIPAKASVFTKFASSLTGPSGDIALVDGNVDWEAELVVVIGREARAVREQDAWDHVAGLTNGQDVSERTRQLAGPAPQFSLAKSHPGFSPIGPWIVTPDELENPDDLEIACAINGEEVQKSRTSDLIFSVPVLIEQLSEVLPLYPGDLIFTGTPSGVGLASHPQRYLAAGDVLTTRIEGLGRMTHRLVASRG